MNTYRYPHPDGSFSFSGYVRECMENLIEKEIEEARRLQDLQQDEEWHAQYIRAKNGLDEGSSVWDEEGNDRS